MTFESANIAPQGDFCPAERLCLAHKSSATYSLGHQPFAELSRLTPVSRRPPLRRTSNPWLTYPQTNTHFLTMIFNVLSLFALAAAVVPNVAASVIQARAAPVILYPRTGTTWHPLYDHNVTW